MQQLFMRFLLIALALSAGLLTGCGTIYATAKNTNGDPVMLLGYDPVAYFTEIGRASCRERVCMLV